jgi:predicted RNase H-like HicB family nuclease
MTPDIPQKYPVEVFWSDDDEGFIAIAPDLPGASAWGANEGDALREIRVAIEGWIEVARNRGNPIPLPSDKSAPPEYSGRFVVKVPRFLHGQLVHRAEAEGCSLNQLVTTLLATCAGEIRTATSVSEGA